MPKLTELSVEELNQQINTYEQMLRMLIKVRDKKEGFIDFEVEIEEEEEEEEMSEEEILAEEEREREEEEERQQMLIERKKAKMAKMKSIKGKSAASKASGKAMRGHSIG